MYIHCVHFTTPLRASCQYLRSSLIEFRTDELVSLAMQADCATDRFLIALIALIALRSLLSTEKWEMQVALDAWG